MPSQRVISHGLEIVVFIPDATERAKLDELKAEAERIEEVKNMRKQYRIRWKPKSDKARMAMGVREMAALIERERKAAEKLQAAEARREAAEARRQAAEEKRQKKELEKTLRAELIKVLERKANAEYQQRSKEYAELLAAEAELEETVYAASSSHQRGS